MLILSRKAQGNSISFGIRSVTLTDWSLTHLWRFLNNSIDALDMIIRYIFVSEIFTYVDMYPAANAPIYVVLFEPCIIKTLFSNAHYTSVIVINIRFNFLVK